jgi:hypothetical protein
MIYRLGISQGATTRPPSPRAAGIAGLLALSLLLLTGANLQPVPSAPGVGLPLAQDHQIVFRSPDPQRLFAYSPGLCLGPDGTLVATLDLGGPGVNDLCGPVFHRELNGVPSLWQGRVLQSTDNGISWSLRTVYPFMHARPFTAGGTLYVLGQADDLMIISSHDGGLSWTPPVRLTKGQNWHQAPGNVVYANGCVYLVMERRVTTSIQGWYVGETAPILMRGKVGTDLNRPENWTFASELVFRNAVDATKLDYFGVPFFAFERDHALSVAPGRSMAPPGWLESNVVQFVEPSHVWYDPAGRTFHLWMRMNTGGTGYAAIAKVVEDGPEAGQGRMITQLETVPSGKHIVFVPCPGGQMKFHVLYDERDGLYWLLCTQATDSMTRPDQLPSDRYSLPNNERRRLQLQYSRNMIDWCFAGLVAVGATERESRHYASMVIAGEDLLILSRSGDEKARSAHDGNLITFHRVREFRRLADPSIRPVLPQTEKLLHP